MVSPYSAQHHQLPRHRARRLALVAQNCISTRPVQSSTINVHPASCRVWAPAKAKRGARSSSGVETQEDEPRHMPPLIAMKARPDKSSGFGSGEPAVFRLRRRGQRYGRRLVDDAFLVGVVQGGAERAKFSSQSAVRHVSNARVIPARFCRDKVNMLVSPKRKQGLYGPAYARRIGLVRGGFAGIEREHVGQ